MAKRRIYLVIQALVCTALVLLLSLSAVSVCREGLARKAEQPLESIYTPEIVAEKLALAAPLFWAGLFLLAAGLLSGINEKGPDKPQADPEILRDLLAARVAQPSESMLRERASQKRLLLAGRTAFALCMVPPAVYCLNPARFPPGDPETMFLSLLRVLLPCAAAGVLALAAAFALREKSFLREADAAKLRLKEERTEGAAPEPEKPVRPEKHSILRAVLIAAAVVFIILGILNGSALDVLYKAITICTECIGLG